MAVISSHRCWLLPSLMDFTLLFLLKKKKILDMFLFLLDYYYYSVLFYSTPPHPTLSHPTPPDPIPPDPIPSTSFYILRVPSHQNRGPITLLKRRPSLGWRVDFSTLLVFCCFLNNLCYFIVSVYWNATYLWYFQNKSLVFKSISYVFNAGQRQSQNERKFLFVS